MFKIGDMAVYPAHGVGKIESIENREVGDLKQSFYVLRILDSNMVIMVPVTNSKRMGLRAIIPAAEVDTIYRILRDRTVEIESQPWNQRYRDYMEKIKTGSVVQIAGVLRDLYMLREDKALSFGERKMMDTAQGLLIKEISIANQEKEELVEKNIVHIFS